MAVYISYYIFSCCPGKQSNKLTFPQVSFISFAALIRGSIAFGLVLKMVSDFKDDSSEHEKPLEGHEELGNFGYFKKDNYANADLYCDPYKKNSTGGWEHTNDLDNVL